MDDFSKKQLQTPIIDSCYAQQHNQPRISASGTTDIVASGFNPMNVNKYPYISASGTTDIMDDKG